MRTDINITYNALNSHYLDTSDMKACEGYLNDAIIMWGWNTEQFYKEIRNGKRKIESIVFDIFADLVNDHIKSIEYPYNQDCRCTSYHLKKWLEQYGNGYFTLRQAVEYFTKRREEAQNA